MIIEMYNSGMSLDNIKDKVGTKTTRTISNIIKSRGYEVKRSTACTVYQYTVDNKLLRVFDSKQDAHKWLVDNYRPTMKRSEAYYYIKKSSENNGVAFGFRWKQVDSNTVHPIKENPNKYRYYCEAYNDDNETVIDYTDVVTASKIIIESNLSTSNKVDKVSGTIKEAARTHIKLYGLYWKVYKICVKE